jgi:hypothetical protein
METIFVTLIFAIEKKFARLIFESVFLIYTAVQIVYFIYAEYFFDGCKPCGFSLGIAGINQKLILALHISFFILYELIKSRKKRIRINERKVI